MPIVIHQALPCIRVDWLSNTGRWIIMGKVVDNSLINAKKRIQQAIKNPKYGLFDNNCEHFARYVTTGIKESKQLQGAVAVIALGALLYSFWDIE
ncbi:MAG: lecithin retinol acyltransferase family protein [Deltaproteobacteria bacterium]|nr:lecithin retinol acyltransferase family protein [Deltaproteobacteria bacterium]